MPKNKFKLIFLILIGVAIMLILWSSLSQPGVHKLEGEFKELGLYRNENNTGPIQRLYAVSLKDTLWQQMHRYGEFMPYTKYGTTRVYFFLNTQPHPNQVQPGPEPIAAAYQPYCIALYEKNSMGQLRFIRYPFK